MTSVEVNSAISVVRALVTSVKPPCGLKDILRSYNESEGQPLPYIRFGFKSPQEFLHHTKEFILRKNDGEVTIAAKPNEKTAHIASMVKHQKTKKKSKSKKRLSSIHEKNTVIYRNAYVPVQQQQFQQQMNQQQQWNPQQMWACMQWMQQQQQQHQYQHQQLQQQLEQKQQLHEQQQEQLQQYYQNYQYYQLMAVQQNWNAQWNLWQSRKSYCQPPTGIANITELFPDMSANAIDLVLKIFELVVKERSGIARKKIGRAFQAHYNQLVPENWLPLVENSKLFVIESHNNNAIIYANLPNNYIMNSLTEYIACLGHYLTHMVSLLNQVFLMPQ